MGLLHNPGNKKGAFDHLGGGRELHFVVKYLCNEHLTTRRVSCSLMTGTLNTMEKTVFRQYKHHAWCFEESPDRKSGFMNNTYDGENDDGRT